MDDYGKLEVKANLEIEANYELYKVVDFLNRNLKDRNVIFGLTKNKDKMTITIYET